MKVFISWSGERSQALASALRDWLPLVLHYINPWLSEADVAAGDRWAQEVAKELEASNYGIICVTPENVGAPWVLFEAGALAKSMQGSRVVPLLYGLEFSDITGPLAQFQAKKVERAGVSEVIQSINRAAELEIPETRAKQLFDALWPELENRLEAIPAEPPTEKHVRPQHEILEELVAGVRGLDGRFRDLETALSPETPRMRRRFLHPMMLEEMLEMAAHDQRDPIGLLLLAGQVRDELPWLRELLLDTYHTMREGDPRSSEGALERLRFVTRRLMDSPLMADFSATSKDAHMMMRELPMLLDSYLHRFESRYPRDSSEPEEPPGEPEKEG